eukprot:403361109
MEVAKFKAQMRRQEIEFNLNTAMLEGIINKKEYDQKMKLIEENKEMIAQAVLNPEDDRLIEQKLGLVSSVREVQNMAQQTSQKVDKEEFQKQVQDSKQLVKRLQEERKEREQKKIQQQKLEQERRYKDEEEKMRQLEEEAFKKEEEKRKKLEEMQRKIQEKEMERMKSKQDGHVKVKHVINAQPLYKQFEEKYQKEVEMPHLELKKKQLEELRNFYKPIQRQDLQEHALKYEQIRSVKQEESRKQRDISIKAERDHQANLRYKLKDNLNLSVIQDSKKVEEELINAERKKYVDKVKNYAKQVKDMYFPKVSEAKQIELEQRKEQLRSQNIRRSMADLKVNSSVDASNGGRSGKLHPLGSGRGVSSSVYKAGGLRANASGFATDVSQDNIDPNDLEMSQIQLQSNREGNKARKVDWSKHKNSMAPQAAPKPNTKLLEEQVYKSTDFLKDLRAKREQDERDGVAPKRVGELQKIEKMLNNPNLSEAEKLEFVKKRAELMEKQALRDEMLIRAGHQDNIEKNIAVNDKYIDAITAKLRILDQI